MLSQAPPVPTPIVLPLLIVALCAIWLWPKAAREATVDVSSRLAQSWGDVDDQALRRLLGRGEDVTTERAEAHAALDAEADAIDRMLRALVVTSGAEAPVEDAPPDPTRDAWDRPQWAWPAT